MSLAKGSWMAQAGDFLAGLAGLTRIRNSATGAAYTLLGAYLAAGASQVSAPTVIRAALVVLCVIASGNVINDYVDAAADAIAKPERSIPSGRVSRRVAGWFAVLLATGALAIACTLEPRLTAFAAGTVVLSVLYSWILKGIPLLGNGTVALLCAAILVFGALAVGGLTPAVYAGAAMTFLFVFAQEVFYTVEDEEGDRQSGVLTTATRLGTARTVLIFRALALLFVVASVLPWWFGVAPRLYVYAVLPCTIAPTLGVVMLVRGRMTAATIGLSSWLTRVVWYSSVVSIVLLRK